MSYQFDKKDIFDLAKYIGADIQVKGEEVNFLYCPFCKGGEHRDKNKFFINTKTGQFICHRGSCGKKGSFYTLAKEVGFPLDFGTKEPLRKNYKVLPQKPISEMVIRDGAIEYLKSRGIPEEIVRKYGITTQKDRSNILCMPFYNQNNNLVMVKYRNTTFKKGDKGSKEWVSKDTMPILYGMQFVNYDNPQLIITEGQLDSLSLATAGVENAVSVPMGKCNFEWVNNCWDFLQRFKEIVVFGDNENGEITLVKEISQKLIQHQIKVIIQADYHGLKDANDILQKYGKDVLKQAVESAEAIPLNFVKSMADVKPINISELPHFSTGIAEIDRLTGGFFEGQLVVIMGSRGEGKSTLASQMIVEAVEQGKNALMYSGELPEYLVKNWVDMQFAGADNLTPFLDTYGKETFILHDDTKLKIAEWYRDRLFIIDEMGISQGEQLIDCLEKAIWQHRIKICLVDNLMCFCNYDGDIFTNQGRIATRLKEIAVRTKSTILLVAHERKNKDREDVSNNISGSADIANRGDVILRYSRDKEIDGQGRIEVSKNRLFGDLATGDKAITAYFDKPSRRISTDKSPNNLKVYSWAKPQQEVIHLDISDLPEDLPF